jgi:uncharacterized protein (DUF924 family)
VKHRESISPTPLDVLDHWLGERSETPPDPARIERWFVEDPAVDAEIRRRFESLVEAALADGLHEWERDPSERVALIVLLDQFPRNLYRGDARSFAGDARALRLTRGFSSEEMATLHPLERYFVLLPWMHSEDLGDQRVGERAYAEAAATVAEPFRSLFEGSREFAARHRELIERFGRFPHRNEMLGRISTPEEAAFLAEVGRGF